ncbi:MAG: hypothetical protein ACR2P1_19695 [Pseudomonadales bacterium]
MKDMLKILVCVLPLLSASAWSQQDIPTELTCDDFRPTPEALERFPRLKGACEAVVERDGELYALFKAVVRQASSRSVTLYLPATDYTFKVEPRSEARVLIGNKKVRSRDLQRGQEITIHLSTQSFATPNIEEVAFVTDTDVIIEHSASPADALPTTASPWPALGLASLALLGMGFVLRRRHLNFKRMGSPLVISLCTGIVSSSLIIGTADAADETSVAKPARILSTLVKSGAIVEAVNKDTRELKLINAQGNRFTVVADDAVGNIDQIKPRDRIVVEYLESVALVVAPHGSEPLIGDVAELTVVPANNKPGIEGVESHVMVATIHAINTADKLVTLETEEGELRTIKASEEAKLDLVDIGDQVRLRVTRAVAVSIEAPPSSGE